MRSNDSSPGYDLAVRTIIQARKFRRIDWPVRDGKRGDWAMDPDGGIWLYVSGQSGAASHEQVVQSKRGEKTDSPSTDRDN